MANEFYLKQGDTFPNIETVLSDEAGPVNLAGATVQFRMGKKGVIIIEAPAIIVTPQTGGDVGRCYYTFTTGQTDVTGTFNLEWRVTFAGGKIATFPRSNNPTDFNKVVIQKDVG